MKMYDGIMYKIVEMPESFSESFVDREVMEVYDKILKGNEECELVVRFTNIKQVHKAEVLFVNKLFDTVAMVNGKMYIIDASESVENALRFQKIDSEIIIFRALIDFEDTVGPLVIDDDDLIESTLGTSLSLESDDVMKSTNKMKLIRVLVIAHSIPDRNNQKSYLEKMDFVGNVSLSKDCNEATKLIQHDKEKIDLVLVDYGSMKASCKSMLKSAHTFTSTKESKILLTCSSNVTETDLKMALENGANASIPINSSHEEYEKIISNMFM